MFGIPPSRLTYYHFLLIKITAVVLILDILFILLVLPLQIPYHISRANYYPMGANLSFDQMQYYCFCFRGMDKPPKTWTMGRTPMAPPPRKRFLSKLYRQTKRLLQHEQFHEVTAYGAFLVEKDAQKKKDVKSRKPPDNMSCATIIISLNNILIDCRCHAYMMKKKMNVYRLIKKWKWKFNNTRDEVGSGMRETELLSFVKGMGMTALDAIFDNNTEMAKKNFINIPDVQEAIFVRILSLMPRYNNYNEEFHFYTLNKFCADMTLQADYILCKVPRRQPCRAFYGFHAAIVVSECYPTFPVAIGVAFKKSERPPDCKVGIKLYILDESKCTDCHNELWKT